MHVEFTEQAHTWGGWVFGDLAVAVCRAVEVLGPSADVVTVAAGQSADRLPVVTLEVPDADEVARLRHEVASGEYVARFVAGPKEDGWVAVVNGIRLCVEVVDLEVVEVL
jgi:hypothetical protein